MERVKFDIALLQQPELTGVEYQRGELFGWEIRSYLLKAGGVHLGRVAVRASGSFRVGTRDGINARYCRVVQRLDGYDYAYH